MDKPFYHALKIDEELCIGCSHCMNSCPTEAIRVWNGIASIDEDKCIDCGECAKVCPTTAIYVEEDYFDNIFKYRYRVALIPSVFVGQFPENIKASQIYSVLHKLGFTHVYEVERAVEVLREAVWDYQKEYVDEYPIISSFCPAIVRLIQVKFPSLVDQIMKLNTPSDIAATFYRKKLTDQGLRDNEIGIFYITPCAAKIASIISPVGIEESAVSGVINSNSLYNRVYREIKNETGDICAVPEPTVIHDYKLLWSLNRGESRQAHGRTLAIDGIYNAIEFLEMVENEEVTGIDFLECRACSQSCAGGILNAENRFLIIERLKKRIERNNQKTSDYKSSGIREYKDFLASRIKLGDIPSRSMMMLDADMLKAMQKMKNSQKIEKELPSIDCGACGAPSCKALAEDIVKGNATLSHCIFIQNKLIKNNEINLDTALGIIRNIWGNRSVK